MAARRQAECRRRLRGGERNADVPPGRDGQDDHHHRKRINDGFSHVVGDEVRAIALVLQKELCASEIPARLSQRSDQLTLLGAASDSGEPSASSRGAEEDEQSSPPAVGGGAPAR